MLTVVITVSDTMRPTGRRRTYTANALGRDFKSTSKENIRSTIRAAVYRAESEAGYVHQPVKFEFSRE